MNKWVKLGVVLVPLLLLGACGATGGAKKGGGAATGGTAGTETTDSSASTSPFGAGGGVDVTPLPGAGGADTLPAIDPLDDPSSPLAKRVIYFDYDSNNIRAEDRATIEAHAQYLSRHGDLKVALEGHADERGSREYNIALGERRANAVRDVMSLLGVSSAQISTVSYGEERPAVLGDDESAWRMNRRVELVYSGQ